MKTGIQKIIDMHLHPVEVPCEQCGKTMIAWKEEEGVSPRCAPVCMECGYKSVRKSEALTTNELFEKSVASKTKNQLKYGSILTDQGLWKCKMDNYIEVDQETAQAKNIANEAIQAILNGEKTHVIYSGKTGVGKSHLAMGILQEVMELSNYRKTCLFINFRELLEQLKFSMNDVQARKQIQGLLMAEIKAADLVAIDDVGAELGVLTTDNIATTYSIDVLTSITEARQDKATVFTTNLTSKQLRNSYGSRVMSRMLKNSSGYIFNMVNTQDKRRQQID